MGEAVSPLASLQLNRRNTFTHFYSLNNAEEANDIMETFRFCKDLYSKSALIKAAYNFTDRAYMHLDSDEKYYTVRVELKSEENQVTEKDFINELLTQSVRHEVYLQTRNIRELLLARALATSVVVENTPDLAVLDEPEIFSEDEILKDWFENHDSD